MHFSERRCALALIGHMKILDFGSLNIDRVYTVKDFVRPGETISSLRLDNFCGGKGLNQAIACKKAGSDVYMAGKVGTDGAMLTDLLREYGVNTDNVIVDPDTPSGHAIIQVDHTGQNNIILFGGTNRKISHDDVDSILAKFDKGDILLLQNEISSLDYILEKAHDKGMVIAMNPSPMDDYLLSCDLGKVTYFIMNEIEAAAISGCTDPEDAIKELHSRYLESRIVITLGSDGVKYFDGEKAYSHGIYKVETVDTTAAGDTFTGYFLNGVLTGMKADDILDMASKASRIAVSRNGAADSIPTKDEVLSAKLELR